MDIETIVIGLSIGSILMLVASGLTFTFGQMNVINMAHGEFIMIGAYTAYVIQQILGQDVSNLTFFIALPLSFVVAAGIGAILERLLISRLYGREMDTWRVQVVTATL